MNFGPVDPADVRTCPLCDHDMAPNGDGCVCDAWECPECFDADIADADRRRQERRAE